MNRPFWIASSASLTLCLGLGFSYSMLETEGTDSEFGGVTDRNDLSIARSAGSLRGHRGGAAGAVLGLEPAPSETADSAGTTGPTRVSRYRLSSRAGGGRAPAPGQGEVSGTGDATGTTGDGDGVALDPLQPLRGAQLTAALEEAIDEGDLAMLHGLLLSELTMEGTQFSADDLPALFDALQDVDDYGLQNLLLTHLDRIDVPPEEKVSGYLDYLENSEHRMHSDAVFKKLVELGGDETLHGLSEMVRGSEDLKLRRQAAEALGGLKDARAVPTLQNALSRAEDPRDARPYAQALAQIGGREAINSLVDYASQSGNEAALSAIMSVKDPAAAQVLAQALNGRVSEAYEKTALRKLQYLADPGALRDLDRYLRQASEPMARLALSAVGRIRDQKAPRVLEDYAANERNPRLAEYAMRAAQLLRKKLAEPPREKQPNPWKEYRVKTETRAGKRAEKRAEKTQKPPKTKTKTRTGRKEERKRDRRA